MDAYSMEVVARLRVEDAHRDAEVQKLLRDAGHSTDEPSSWRRRPTLRWLRRLARPAAAA
jgi:hypothetical protein